MARRKQAELVDIHADDWVRDVSRAGQVVRIQGVRGTYKIVEEVLTEAGAEWVQLWGGAPGHGSYRFIAPDRIRWPKSKKNGDTA